MNRIKRGYLEIKGRKHFVYEGLNIIGRNKDAMIILPDATVSHNHSIIMVAKGCHYLGDTKSQNGTFLNDLKLSPLELYDLNVKSCIKFGLVIGTYSKLRHNPDEHNTETQDAATEVMILENAFDTPTQVLLNDTNDKLLGILNETKNVLEGGSINELPTQIIDSNCDIDTEVDVVDTVISVHDMPTQIITIPKEGSEANESLIGDQQNESRISSDIIEETLNDDNNIAAVSALDEVEEISEKKKIVSEDDDDDEDDENSRESIDFSTMQPAATQSWFSDSQNLLAKNVLQLKNRVKYVIMSDEDSTVPTIEDDGTTTLGDSDTDIGIGGPSTSSISNKKRKKLTKVKKKVSIIRSDSDTDVEKEEKKEDDNVKEFPIVPATTTTTTEATSAQLQRETAEVKAAVTEAILNSDSDTDVEGANVEGKLDDSDIIPTSQQVQVPSTEFKSYSQLRKEDITTNAVVSQNTKNFEASLTDSFQLMLTDSSNVELDDDEEKCENVTSVTVVPIVDKQVVKEPIEDGVNDAAVDKEPKDWNVNKGESQIELEFVVNNVVSSPQSQNRPKNPLLNIFNAEDGDNKDDNKENEEENGKNIEIESSAYDVIEDNLEKMFAPTQVVADDDDDNLFDLATQKVDSSKNKSKDAFVKPAPPSRSKDEIFLQPTQILPPDGEDIFSLPTQICTDDTLNTKLDQEKVVAVNQKDQDKEEDDSTIFFQPTQILIVDADVMSPSIDKNLDTVITSKTTKDGKHDVCGDEFLKPRSPPSLVTNNVDNDRDEVFSKPTQILPVDDDVFSMPTQVCADLSTNLNGRKDGDDKEIEEDDSAIFLQPTQLLTTDSDVVPSTMNKNPIVEESGDSKTKGETISEVDAPKNDIFLEPTQILDSENELNTNQEEDKKKKNKQSQHEETEKTTATEEDAIFMEPTQVIQVDNEEIRKNIDDGEPMTILVNDVDKVEVDNSTPAFKIEKKMEEKSKKAEKDKTIDLSISNLTSAIEQSSKRGRRTTRKTKAGNVSTEDDEENVGAAKKPKITEAESKVENKIEKNSSRIGRRSTRKKSADEKRIGEKNGSRKGGDLYVIEEINSPTIEKNEDDDIRPSSLLSASTSTDSMVVDRRARRTTKRILSSSSSTTNSPIPIAIMAESVEESSSKNEKPTKRARKEKKIDDIPITAAAAASTSNAPHQSASKVTEKLITRNSKRKTNPASVTPSTSKNVKEILVDDNNSSDDDFVTTIRVTPKKESKLKETPKKKSSVAATRSTRKMKIVEEKPPNDKDDNELEDRLSSTNSTNTDSESTTTSSNTNRSTTIGKGRTRGNKTAENVALSEDNLQENKRQRGKPQPPPTTPKRINTTSATSPSLLITPDRNKRKLKPKIVFTMLESPQLETIIRSLGGIIVDSLEASTVLVTGSVKRSQKLLSAVGHSKPICSPKWLHESKKANSFLDPWEYVLKDDKAEEKWNFSLKESLRRSGEKKLFENFTFQLLVNAAQDVLKGSIESCGGKCVSRAPAKDAYGNFVIVANPENRSKYARFLKQTPKPIIVAPEAIFDGVLRQELHFDDHSLT